MRSIAQHVSTKRVILSVLFAITNLFTMAQDVIVKRDGNTILAKVTKVGDKEVEYKKYKSSSERIYSISTADIISINYEDGDRDTFDANTPSVKNDTPSQKLVSVPASADNNECISHYNNQHFHSPDKQKSKAATFGLFMLGVKSESILSNEDLEIYFLGIGEDQPWMKPGIYAKEDFVVMIVNKTNNPIYIDLGNSFSIEDSGIYRVYYDNNSTTISNGHSGGAAINLGGIANILGIGGTIGTLAGSITAGGQNSQNVTTTYSKNRILIIPPKAVSALSDFSYQDKIVLTEAESVMPPYTEVSSNPFESLRTHSRFERGFVSANQVRTFEENNSPYSRDYIVTYSKQNDFSSYSVLTFGVYMKEIVGVNYFRSNPTHEMRFGANSRLFWYSKYINGTVYRRRMIGFYGFQ